MQELERAPQDFISLARGLVQLVSWPSVITKVGELTGAQVQSVRPVLFFATRVKDNVLLVRPASRGAKSTLVSHSLKYLGDWVIGCISLTASLIDGVDHQIR